jgi:hypothetical protein
MQFNNVLVLVSGGPTDSSAVSHAASLVRETHGHLMVLYVIQVDRSMPLDAEMPEQVSRAEQALNSAELEAKLQRPLIEAEILQAREIGAAVVHEAAVRDVDAVVISIAFTKYNGRCTLGPDIQYVMEFAACNIVLLREEIAGARPERRQLVGRSETGSG